MHNNRKVALTKVQEFAVASKDSSLSSILVRVADIFSSIVLKESCIVSIICKGKKDHYILINEIHRRVRVSIFFTSNPCQSQDEYNNCKQTNLIQSFLGFKLVSYSLGIFLLKFYQFTRQAAAFITLSIELRLQAAELIRRLVISIW